MAVVVNVKKQAQEVSQHISQQMMLLHLRWQQIRQIELKEAAFQPIPLAPMNLAKSL